MYSCIFHIKLFCYFILNVLEIKNLFFLLVKTGSSFKHEGHDLQNNLAKLYHNENGYIKKSFYHFSGFNHPKRRRQFCC